VAWKIVSVVLPIHNESESLEELVQRLSQTFNKLAQDFEIVMVDDGSSDGSLDKIKSIANTNSKVRVIELARNYGQTAALAAGIDNSNGDVIITMDADLQHVPEEIPRFLAKLEEGFDIVSGWRETRTDGLLLRRIPSFCANRLMRMLSGIQITDFASTFKAYRAETAKSIELFGELHRFIPVLASRLGAKIVEIPIKVEPRKKGQSKYGLSRVLGVFEDLVFLEFYANYLTKPIRAFGRLFFFFFGTGFLISVVLMFLWLIGSIGGVIEHAAMLLFSVFMMSVGVIFLVTGILAELISRIYINTNKTKIYKIRER
jgi:glycosyltransferase involved in cell wall biosynthesis